MTRTELPPVSARWRWFLIPTVVVLLLGSLWPEQWKPGKAGTDLVGMVTLEGEPLSDARLLLVPRRLGSETWSLPPIATAVTDDQGRFTVENFPRADRGSGACWVIISKRLAVQPEKKIGLVPDGPTREGDAASKTTAETGTESAVKQLLARLPLWMQKSWGNDPELVPAHYNRDTVLILDPADWTGKSVVFRLTHCDPWSNSQPEPARITATAVDEVPVESANQN